jgi:hypothetical protein
MSAAKPDALADHLSRHPHSRHLPVASTEGNLTKNLNKTGVRLWA